ncbi:unnamed protein product [Pieris macdunnoughi]|uniref:Uncharacterized protein n=1 Tax=Pieris macdunnoughi TaxID=345717 RepID=A0A821WBU7_9NEOP|nr:unnamed protein product [Pieris macdunnoughi]
MLEVPGVDREEKADALADRLRVVLSGEALVGRPVKCADLLIRDLDDSVTERDVTEAVAAMGGCPAEAIKPGKILRRGIRGLGRCSSCVRSPPPRKCAKESSSLGGAPVGLKSERTAL